MIDKLISYAFMEINKLYFEEKATIYCEKYSHKLLNTLLEGGFLIYERDDILEQQQLEEQYFYKATYHGFNEWEDMVEPVTIC
jgi:hypothetical protein